MQRYRTQDVHTFLTTRWRIQAALNNVSCVSTRRKQTWVQTIWFQTRILSQYFDKFEMKSIKGQPRGEVTVQILRHTVYHEHGRRCAKNHSGLAFQLNIETRVLQLLSCLEETTTRRGGVVNTAHRKYTKKENYEYKI